MPRNRRGRLVRRTLQDVSIAYRNNDYVADLVFPIINGVSRIAKVPKGVRGAWFRDDAGVRAPGTPAPRGYNDVATSNLDPKNFAYSTNVPDEDFEVPPAGDAQEYASWILRRLVDAGWLEREQQADYTEFIILPDYAFTLLEALRTIQEQKPREYTGQLYAAHQLLTNQGDDFSPALALPQRRH